MMGPVPPRDPKHLVIRTQPWVVATLVALAIAVFALSITVLILALNTRR